MRRVVVTHVERTIVVRRVPAPSTNTLPEKPAPSQVASNGDGCGCLLLLGVMATGALATGAWICQLV